MGYVMQQAVAQAQDGAEILDVNVGVPGIDEPAAMQKVVRAVQSVCDLPLQIDSANPDAIEAGLRVCSGRAVVNSVNGKDEVLERLLPIVKKYGAVVIGLTLDENGIPETAEERVKIAEKIVRRAWEYGIPPRDIVIDCLTLTVGAGAQNARVTLDAVRAVTALGLKTALGVSNVSFGLPNRELVNRTFFTLALEAGLTLPIINPGDRAMKDALAAFLLLSGREKADEAYLSRFAGGEPPAPQTVQTPLSEQTGEEALVHAIHAGLEQQAAQAARSLLVQTEPQKLINGVLIPVLDEVGAGYESGKLFLPQLIRCAQAAKAAFDEVRAVIARQKQTHEERGTVVLATVQGDIHDIGKNIVRAVMENYGYRIIDLGRDVAPKEVAEAVERSRAGLVGLSALMTTTLPAMQETISLLAGAHPGCRVVVGGAVLTEKDAERMGAHYYAKDAAAAVGVAREVFGR
jgi:5-methyltetrahydrofolate--homocysteine methyltransferase